MLLCEIYEGVVGCGVKFIYGMIQTLYTHSTQCFTEHNVHSFTRIFKVPLDEYSVGFHYMSTKCQAIKMITSFLLCIWTILYALAECSL